MGRHPTGGSAARARSWAWAIARCTRPPHGPARRCSRAASSSPEADRRRSASARVAPCPRPGAAAVSRSMPAPVSAGPGGSALTRAGYGPGRVGHPPPYGLARGTLPASAGPDGGPPADRQSSRTRCRRAASVRHLRSTTSSGYCSQSTGDQSGPGFGGAAVEEAGGEQRGRLVDQRRAPPAGRRRAARRAGRRSPRPAGRGGRAR